MPYPIDFTGCKALVFDEETRQAFYKGVASEFDRNEVVITLEGFPDETEGRQRVSLLLLHGGDAYEFQGRVRQTRTPGRTEIALLKGKRKEDRDAKRYRVNAPAQIECLVMDGAELPLRQPLGAFVENVSANGLLLRTIPGILQPETAFKLRIDIGGNDTIITATVVRVEELGGDRAEYGCRVNFVD